MNKFSHTDAKGKAKMVDVGDKPLQNREAHATGFIRLNEETIRLIRENEIKKGDVLTVAQIAGIQAAKKTSELIPLCHPLFISGIDVIALIEDKGVRVKSVVRCTGQTGAEMEALTAVNIALLTVYDMCKAVDKNMIMEEIKLLKKEKSDINE